MRLVAFDLEIAKELPDAPPGEYIEWEDYMPLGISCADAAYRNGPGITHQTWHGSPQMTVSECRKMVADLKALVGRGYTIVTFNGLGFDFRVLAQESEMHDLCHELAMDHVDIMFQWFCRYGWRIGLDATAKANGVVGKKKSVQLKDGTMLYEMEGSQAPRLWAEGETEAVLSYLYEDTRSLLELAETIAKRRLIRYRSQSGRNWKVTGPLLTVNDALATPEPDTSWMSAPTRRDEYFAWTVEDKEIV